MTRTWYTIELPPRRGTSAASQVVWLALSDGRVARGECLFNRAGQPHQWFLESDNDGNPQRALAVGIDVVAWALPEEAPTFPYLPAQKRRRL